MAAGRITVPAGDDFVVSTIKLPWQSDIALGDSLPGLHVEAGLGYFDGRSSVPDIWGGVLPGFETRVRSRWEGVSGFVGCGPRFRLGSGLHLSTLADASLSYLENKAYYQGPGAALSAGLFDGILFNWHSTSFAVGGALRLDHEVELLEDTTLSSLLRYDVRYFNGIESTDAAQDVEDALQRIVARTEIAAPTGVMLWGGPVRWNAHFGYARFLGDDDSVIGFVDYYEVGIGLTSPVPFDGTPVQALKVSGAILVGEDMHGWSLGGSLAF